MGGFGAPGCCYCSVVVRAESTDTPAATPIASALHGTIVLPGLVRTTLENLVAWVAAARGPKCDESRLGPYAQLADGWPVRHRQSLRPCRCHSDVYRGRGKLRRNRYWWGRTAIRGRGSWWSRRGRDFSTPRRDFSFLLRQSWGRIPRKVHPFAAWCSTGGSKDLGAVVALVKIRPFSLFHGRTRL